MQIINVTAKNFLSFKELSYDFGNTPVLIQGENLTEDSQESNGSGKSSLQAAVEYGLFKATEKPSESDLIFWGEDKADVILVLDCPIRKQAMQIRRSIILKGSSKLEIDINGVPQSFATVVDGNRFILDWIGISKEDLQNYYIINKERYKSFFSASNKEKIEMINRFSNAKIIDGVEKFVQDDVLLFEQDLKNYERNKTSLIATIRTLNDQVSKELNRDLEQETKDLVEAMKEQIVETEGELSDNNEAIQLQHKKIGEFKVNIQTCQSLIVEHSKTLTAVENSLQKLVVQDFSDQYKVIDEELNFISVNKSKAVDEQSILGKNKAVIEATLLDIEKNITGSVTCPKCSHQFLVGDPDINIEDEKAAKIEIEALLVSTTISIAKIIEKVDSLTTDYKTTGLKKADLQLKEDEVAQKKRDIKREIEKIDAKLTSLRRDISTLEDNILKCESTIGYLTDSSVRLNKSIEELEEQILNTKAKEIDMIRVNELRKQMRAEGEKLRNINYSIRRKKIQIFETSQWVLNFKKFNMFLANSSLKVIQGYCNKFLQDIKSDIQIKWEGIKMLGNGTLKEEITPYIIRDNRMRGFWTFSGGERVRMEYAMILTLQRMINSTHKYGGLDFLSTDEIGEGIDALGLSDLMSSLSNMNKTIMLTTHVTNRSIGGNVLLIRKENGVSKIVKN